MNNQTEDHSKDSQKRERKPATTGASSITAETRVKDFLPQGLLEDIRTLKEIYDRLDKYHEEKKADETTWETFSEGACMAMDHVMSAIYDMSSIAGRELDYKILNH